MTDHPWIRVRTQVEPLEREIDARTSVSVHQPANIRRLVYQIVTRCEPSNFILYTRIFIIRPSSVRTLHDIARRYNNGTPPLAPRRTLSFHGL